MYSFPQLARGAHVSLEGCVGWMGWDLGLGYLESEEMRCVCLLLYFFTQTPILLLLKNCLLPIKKASRNKFCLNGILF